MNFIFEILRILAMSPCMFLILLTLHKLLMITTQRLFVQRFDCLHSKQNLIFHNTQKSQVLKFAKLLNSIYGTKWEDMPVIPWIINYVTVYDLCIKLLQSNTYCISDPSESYQQGNGLHHWWRMVELNKQQSITDGRSIHTFPMVQFPSFCSYGETIPCLCRP